MISLRWTAANAPDVKIKPPSAERALRRIAKDSRAPHAWRDLFEQLEPFPAQAVFELHEAGRVAARPREAIDESAADRVGHIHEHNRHGARCLQQWPQGCGARCQNDVWRQGCQFRRVLANGVGQAFAPSIINPEVAALGPTQLLQRLHQHRVAHLHIRIIRVGAGSEYTDTSHGLALLRPRRERPRGRAAEQSDKLAPLHSITSSASNCKELGTSRPSAWAVCMLITNSNLVDCSTGRSAGLAPLRI